MIIFLDKFPNDSGQQSKIRKSMAPHSQLLFLEHPSFISLLTSNVMENLRQLANKKFKKHCQYFYL